MNQVIDSSALYEEITLIHKGEETLVHRARRASDGVRVIRKSLRARHPTTMQRARQRHEYSLLSELESPGVIRAISLEQGTNGPVLNLEDHDGMTLAERITEGTIGLPEFFDIANSVIEALGDIHRAHIVHKDINPDNILWLADRKQALIIDFGIANRVAREYHTDGAIEGTLAYLAPEQSGRTNRPIDWRADYYGLGATLYELLYGNPPFVADDPMTMVHAHLAKRPSPPEDIRNDVPSILWQLIEQLLAKSADDRYQSTRGIAADLNCIAAAIADNSRLPESLQSVTLSDRFELPGRLYGRSKEMKSLSDAYARVLDGRNGIISLRGPSGSGKSALAGELSPMVAQGGGYFVSGKFDRYGHDVPYAPLMQAASSLLSQILASGEMQLRDWRERVAQAVGSNGALIAEFVREVTTLIGVQEPPEQLSADQNRNRFRRVLLRFFQALASADKPLVLFVDDLQWADLGSLDLIRSLLTLGDARGLLIVASYRDNEVTGTHPVKTMLDELSEAGVYSEAIEPGVLNNADAIALISDTTHRSHDDCRELAARLLELSDGRPYFLREMLIAAHEGGAIQFDPGLSAFSWDMEAIQGLTAQVNLGGLLVERIERMPELTRRLLSVASCVGSHFDPQMIAELEELTVTDVFEALQPAFDAGLVRSLGTGRLSGVDANKGANQVNGASCSFEHDEVIATAYSLVEQKTRLDRHARIAEILEQRVSADGAAESVFELVRQVMLGFERITDPGDRHRYAKHFQNAARRAAESAAFSTGLHLVRDGRSLLPENPWDYDYRLWIDFARIGAEAAALSGDKTQLDEIVAEVEAHAQSTLDETEVVAARISYFAAHLQPAEALTVARKALNRLGVALPKKASLLHVSSGLIRTMWAMRGKTTEDLGKLPAMTDPESLAAMRILLRTISPAYIADPNMFPLIVLHMVRLSLERGNSSESPFGYVTYGILLSAGLGQLDKGTELGRFALQLAESDPSNKLRAKLAVSFYVTLHHWKQHLGETLPPLLAGHHAGLETGDIEYACHCAWYYCSYLTWSGESLDEVEATQSSLIAAIDEHNSEFHSVCGRIFHQLVSTLADDSVDVVPNTLSGDSFNEQTDVEELIEKDNFTAMFLYHQCRATLNYLLGDESESVRHGLKARKYEQNVLGSTNVAQNIFYLALSTVRNLPQMSPLQRLLARKRINSYRRRLRRWTAEGPATYAHKHHMVEGEWMSARGRNHEALVLFDQARAGARAGRFLQDEALALELMARCQMQMGIPNAAGETLRAAWSAWLSWGGNAKARHLEAEFPEHIDREVTTEIRIFGSTYKRKSSRGTDNISNQLDVASALKASRAMVEEIVLESLLDKLMRVLVENAGAQTGALVLNVDGEAQLCAVGDIDQHHFEVLNSISVRDLRARESGVRLPLRVMDYVWRSGQVVVLDDATKDSRFSEDPDIFGRAPLSILAAPLEHRGRLVGLIYLENARTLGAFTDARVSMIQVLASQAAISIQNAQLYQNLRDQADNLSQLNQSLARFVPNQFLASLGHDSVTNVRLGENIHREMSVLFSDIRGFTTLIESLDSDAHVDFINEYLSYMEPAIVESGGFVDSYIGDAIMALFDSADDAVNAAIRMTDNLQLLNETRTSAGKSQLRIGIGISTGPLTLGTIGGPQRIKCGVIGNTVNLAARIESLTQTYGASLLISHYTRERLSTAKDVTLRQMERVTVKGQTQPVTLFEVLDALPADEHEAKAKVLDVWKTGIEAYYSKDFDTASEAFSRAASSFSGDLAARRFVSNCWRYLDDGAPDDWNGIVNLDHK